jgi:dihydrofolate synthase / folylpolyglutamate synthase
VSIGKSDVVLARLMELHPKLIDLSLGRVETLLVRLGNPEKHLPPVVHVAGTNGKGSTIATMRAALEGAGKRVHAYTSPHLVRFHERIRIAGELIDENDLTALLEECEAANQGEPITFFEITTVAAFLAFKRRPADVVLLETGLGGRLDATNLIDKPRLTIITPVSLDHQQFLGDSLGEIAAEKAGILKTGVPCVMARQLPQARAAIREAAAVVKAPVLEQGVDWHVSTRGDSLVYDDARGRDLYPLPNLQGPHQLDNAGLAITALRRLGDLRPTSAMITEGLRKVTWPGRLQQLKTGPLLDGLPQNWELWLDGGHNAAAGESLAAHVSAAWRDRPVHLVVGMMNSKAAGDFLEPLAARAATIHTVAIPGEENSFSAEELAKIINARPMSAVADAITAITSKNPVPARILVCGSLYLAGTVLADNA